MAHPLTTGRTPRPALAWGAVLGILAFPALCAAAEPLAMAVHGGVDVMSGGVTVTQPDFLGPTVDFGVVANAGPQPRNGSRIDLEDGTSFYVATFEIVVERRPGEALGVRSLSQPSFIASELPLGGGGLVTPPASGFGVGSPSPVGGGASVGAVRARPSPITPRGGMKRAQSSQREGYYIPSASEVFAQQLHSVDLFVRLDGMNMGGATVWFASGDGVDWASGGPMELSVMDLQVASGVPLGAPFSCQVALRVPPSEWGLQNASVSFTARPSLL